MTEAGWYNDDDDPDLARWHNGQRWTEHTIVKETWPGPGMPPPPAPRRVVFPNAPISAPTPPPLTPRPRTRTRKAKREPRWWVGLVVVAVVALAIIAAVAGGDDDAKGDQTAHERSLDDATVGDCGTDDVGHLHATVTVRNTSSDRSNYFVEVSFGSPSGVEELASVTTPIIGLDPGQSTTVDALSSEDAAGRVFQCEVEDLTRVADQP